MINVRVRKQDGIERLRIKQELLVLPNRLAAVPLEQPAVQKQPQSIRLEQMPGARHLPHPAAEGEPHDARSRPEPRQDTPANGLIWTSVNRVDGNQLSTWARGMKCVRGAFILSNTLIQLR